MTDTCYRDAMRRLGGVMLARGIEAIDVGEDAEAVDGEYINLIEEVKTVLKTFDLNRVRVDRHPCNLDEVVVESDGWTDVFLIA